MKKILLTLSVFLSLAVFAEAQATAAKNEKVETALRQISLNGGKLGDFVPAGWEINGTAAQGDLNGDGLADYAFSIALKDEPEEGSECHNTVIILFAERSGGLRRTGLNNNLSVSGFCERQNVKIQKNTVVTNSNYGNDYATDVTFRFRYEPTAKQMMLIGFDWQAYTRSGRENAHLVSYNLLTGVKEETVKYINEGGNGNALYGKQTSNRTRFERFKIPFEKATYDLNDKGIAIPVVAGK